MNKNSNSHNSTRIQKSIPPVNENLSCVISNIVSEIIIRIDYDENCDDLLKNIIELTENQQFDKKYFESLYSWSSPKEFANQASMGTPPSFEDLTISEVHECLDIIHLADVPRSAFCLEMLMASFPSVPVSDMIYWPEIELSHADLAREIVRRGKIQTLDQV